VSEVALVPELQYIINNPSKLYCNESDFHRPLFALQRLRKTVVRQTPRFLLEIDWRVNPKSSPPHMFAIQQKLVAEVDTFNDVAIGR